MNAGLRRQPAFGRIMPLAFAGLLLGASLTGCTLFRLQPAPIVEAAPILPPEAPQPSSEAAAPAAASVPFVYPTPIVERPPRKPKPKPRAATPEPEVVEETPVAPPAAPPLVIIRSLSSEQARGLLESQVRKADGRVVGRAVDMLADSSGRPRTLVVNLTGFLGVGDRKVAFPWRDFRFDPAEKKAPISLGASAVESRAEAAPAPAVSNAALLPISDASVQRPNGDEIGRVVDILVDNAAQPQGVVVDLDSSPSSDKRKIALSWSALQVIVRGKTTGLNIQISDQQLRAAPPYASDKPVRVVSPAPVAPVAATSPAAATANPGTTAGTSSGSGSSTGTNAGTPSGAAPGSPSGSPSGNPSGNPSGSPTPTTAGTAAATAALKTATPSQPAPAAATANAPATAPAAAPAHGKAPAAVTRPAK